MDDDAKEEDVMVGRGSGTDTGTGTGTGNEDFFE
jgi:hypothetical protein